MKRFYNPVKISFVNKIEEIGSILKEYGNTCLLVIQDNFDVMRELRDQFITIMNNNNVNVQVFNEIRANPLYSDIEKGIDRIRSNRFDYIVALGGGSTIDSAKIISFANEYELNWEDMYSKEVLKVNKNKLPLIAIPTTSGTGSHVTQASVVSDLNNMKHTIFSNDFFPTEALVIAELTLTLPKQLTASTGFDAFCHLSESYINNTFCEINEILTLAGMDLIFDNLPKLMHENKLEYRRKLSIADTYAGLSLSNGGANIPHTFGERISSCVYRINHGQSLAIIYPYFVKHFYDHDTYHGRLQKVLTILNDKKEPTDNIMAVKIICDFLTKIDLKYNLSDYDVTELERSQILKLFTKQKRFDYKNMQKFIDDIIEEGITKHN